MFNSSATGVMTPLKPPDIRYTGTLRWCSTSTSRLQDQNTSVTLLKHILKLLFNNMKNAKSKNVVSWVMISCSFTDGYNFRRTYSISLQNNGRQWQYNY
jgi:hypothetical protein